MKNKMYRYKFLREVDGKIKSSSGDVEWKIGELKKFNEKLILCQAGFHCSKDVWQAFSYVQGEVLSKVEVSGNSIIENDKEVWEKMKIVKAYKWQKKDSVELAIYSAELVIGNFEKEYPNDDRPRKAIEAAAEYVENPTEENRQAAESAAGSARSAAWSAGSAESAAWSARSAAWSAGSAESAWSAGSAAGSARSAAESAESAESAARSAIIKKIADWMEKRVKSLEEIK